MTTLSNAINGLRSWGGSIASIVISLGGGLFRHGMLLSVWDDITAGNSAKITITTTLVAHSLRLDIEHDGVTQRAELVAFPQLARIPSVLLQKEKAGRA